MKVSIATKIDSPARLLSFQQDFPQVTKCCRCKGEARLGFVAHELDNKKGEKSVCSIWPNRPKTDGYWLHDLCAVAIYFCKKCLQPTALYNQG